MYQVCCHLGEHLSNTETDFLHVMNLFQNATRIDVHPVIGSHQMNLEHTLHVMNLFQNALVLATIYEETVYSSCRSFELC